MMGQGTKPSSFFGRIEERNVENMGADSSDGRGATIQEAGTTAVKKAPRNKCFYFWMGD